jgi:hypothetical protein
MYTRLLGVLLVAAVLSGCAVGQKFDYAGTSIAIRQAAASRSAAVAVLDQREYVKNGKKPETFVGLSRGGFGNPFDVNTSTGAPLASDMTTSIVSALRAQGFKVHAVAVRPAGGFEGAQQALIRIGAERNLLFTLNEWKTDTMMRTGLDFDVTLDVLDDRGGKLAQSRSSGKEVSGSGILSAEKDAQAWFAAKVSQLLRDESVARTLE